MQAQVGSVVSRADVQPGDLVLCDSPVSHASMYTGTCLACPELAKGSGQGSS